MNDNGNQRRWYVPMKTISDCAIKMHCYELQDYESGAIRQRGIGTYDKSNSHPKPLEQISQGPDRKRARVGGLNNRKCVESYCSDEHLIRWVQFRDTNTDLGKRTHQREDQECSRHGEGAKTERFSLAKPHKGHRTANDDRERKIRPRTCSG